MRYFNTTLVTVYLPKFIHLVFQKKFQYNSCYCLSYTPDGTVLYENHFNTTLVTVYHNDYLMPVAAHKFQYNSCYCLSNTFKPFFFFIIVSFSDKINVSLYFSQPPSIFSHFSPMWPQMAISRGLLTLIDFIGWEISKIL